MMVLCRMKRSHVTKYTYLDEKRRIGTMKRKDIGFLNDVISSFFFVCTM